MSTFSQENVENIGNRYWRNDVYILNIVDIARYYLNLAVAPIAGAWIEITVENKL